MKREIKFRCKRLDNGEWIYGDLIENQGRFFIYHATSESTITDNDDGRISLVAIEVDPATVGQFTGVYDYDDKEIYEGDLVTYPEYMGDDGYPTPSRHVYEDTPHKVVFKEGCFWLMPQYDEWQGAVNFSDMSMEYKPRVVGNIHDNPRFIKNSVWKKS